MPPLEETADPAPERRTDEDAPLDPRSVDLARAMRDLGEAILTRSVNPDLAVQLTGELDKMRAALAPQPLVSKHEMLGGNNRIQTFLDTGQWPAPPPDGSNLLFDPISVVGGELHPFGMGARYERDGDEVVGRVNLSRCFEGPPERVHGGVICAIFDEVMGSVFRATGTASAFTGELSVRFVGPAPLGEDLVFKAREVRTEGRKRFLEGEASTSNGPVFATSTALFIDMKPEHFIVD